MSAVSDSIVDLDLISELESNDNDFCLLQAFENNRFPFQIQHNFYYVLVKVREVIYSPKSKASVLVCVSEWASKRVKGLEYQPFNHRYFFCFI